APHRVAVTARRRARGHGDASRIVVDLADRRPGVEAHRDAPAGQALVAKRFDGDLLLLPAASSPFARRDEAGLAERHGRVAELRVDLLFPGAVLDRVQHRDAPVVLLRTGLHAQDRRRLAAEGETGV